MKPKSLMQRRKLKLGQLGNNIQALSILQRQKQSLETSLFFKRQSKSANNIEEAPIQQDKYMFLKSIPVVQGPKELSKSQGSTMQQNLKTFNQCFETHQILGEGAHGVVKKCTNLTNGHQYAVKILQMEDEHFHFLKTNFINIKQLKHNSVIQYKALFLNSKQRKCHLVMQYLPFPHLKVGLKEDELKAVFYKLLEGLEYIHENGICHRDIKPENILYDKSKQLFKIIDFGVSKNMKLRGRYEEMLTKTGTLYYKAPEMFDGGGYTQKVDCWAVGVTLYEMIVGCTPFASEYLAQTIDNILHKEPDLEREQFKQCDPFLKDLVFRLLKKNPKERLSCEEAKKHLWFNANLSQMDMLKSDNYCPLRAQTNELAPPLKMRSVFRKISVTNEKREQLSHMSESDKKLIKAYLSLMSIPPQIIEEKVTFDFLSNEGDVDEFLMPKKQNSNLLDYKLQATEFDLPESAKKVSLQVRRVD